MKVTVDACALPIDDLRDALEPRGFEFLPAAAADPEPGDINRKPLEAALDIISHGSFPVPGRRDSLTPIQRRWMERAIVAYAHLREGRDVLLTNDLQEFIDGGRRERFYIQLGMRVMTPDEFRAAYLNR